MIDYHKEEARIFKQWKKKAAEFGEGDIPFAEDGLLYKGIFKYENGCWKRYPGDESRLWRISGKNLLILTKDSTIKGELYDVRIEAGRINFKGDKIEPTYRNAFYDNLHLWSYGILMACSQHKIILYDNTPSWKELRLFYEEAPIARVNCKKQMGANSISNSTLQTYLDRYKEPLTTQISLYDSDIILCGGGSSKIKDFVKENYLPDLKPVIADKADPWLYFSEEKGKLVIDSYHPAYPAARGKNTYNALMSELQVFLSLYPNF